MRAAWILPVLAAAIAPRAALAQTAPAAGATPHEHQSLLDRPHTVLDLDAGIIALPNAAISTSNRGGSTPFGTFGNGDATVLTGVHILYRATRDWAFGAGALFAPRPTSDSNFGGGIGGVAITHSRSYLTMGAEARYFPLRSRWLEGWFGLTAGGVIISDRYTETNAPQVPPILGTGSTTASTEGFGVGFQIGGDYLMTDNWVIGLTLRADRWFLPSQQAEASSCTNTGFCSTLNGSVAAFELGLSIGYRIPL
ncbi:MAG TPA: hypothetical protein VF765_34645 [Polyangiaceae bacterium]